uniref:PAS domain-containing protein n=1 Tax=Rhabditophanes sp. KR3021 TaxID=114890 RepID=A0AC35TGQ0_9BILA
MARNILGHSRNQSQGQHLIEIDHPEDEEDVFDMRLHAVNSGTSEGPRYYKPDSITTTTAHIQTYNTLASDCGSYYRPSNGIPRDSEPNFCCFKNAYLHANARVVILSMFLTIFGVGLIAFGIISMVCLSHIDLHGWLFMIVGILFFIPGCYHCVYIVCALCGRPGYEFENLPTFRKP